MNDGYLNQDILDSKTSSYDSEYIRRVSFDNSLNIIIDGKNNKALISEEEII